MVELEIAHPAKKRSGFISVIVLLCVRRTFRSNEVSYEKLQKEIMAVIAGALRPETLQDTPCPALFPVRLHQINA